MTFIIIVFVYGIMHSTLFKENMMWQTFNLGFFKIFLFIFYITLMESLNIEYNAQNLIKNIILR